eukprot:3109365-Rhodomonas_salina.1
MRLFLTSTSPPTSKFCCFRLLVQRCASVYGCKGVLPFMGAAAAQAASASVRACSSLPPSMLSMYGGTASISAAPPSFLGRLSLSLPPSLYSLPPLPPSLIPLSPSFPPFFSPPPQMLLPPQKPGVGQLECSIG